jgi:hypothetical protein
MALGLDFVYRALVVRELLDTTLVERGPQG